ncbi:ArdC-like ssDNA-binding domain-containing protein [Sinorhizobium medicae]|uniref:ArdC-like ssDNA-binding domain-containing protein n=1 Tax=Sinorhizobium medicae TaxID=110321 RepID=UPI001EEBCE5A|nr:ArdC-like ssDNA-binding domain-containing protein [Sinorhizobium medicae]
MQSIEDAYQRITDAIIEQLEAGTKPWIRPWRGNSRGSLVPRRATGEAYRGINVLMLWLASELAGYEENTWMTYRQAQDLGGQVRKGEKGSLVVKYGTFTPKEREDDDERAIPYLKGYPAFNIEQIENLPDRFYLPVVELPAVAVPHLGTVETFVRNTGAAVTYGGTTACYRPAPDDILMPDRARFIDEVHLYSTLLHEMSHYAVRRIMPHGQVWRLLCLLLAMWQFGIIRAFRGRRAVRREGVLIMLLVLVLPSRLYARVAKLIWQLRLWPRNVPVASLFHASARHAGYREWFR